MSGHRHVRNHRHNLNDIADATEKAAQDVKEDAVSMGRQVRDTVEEKAAALRDAASEKVDELREAAGDYYDAGVQRARDFEGTLEARIRANPLAAMGIAAGLGCLVGIVFLRRR